MSLTAKLTAFVSASETYEVNEKNVKFAHTLMSRGKKAASKFSLDVESCCSGTVLLNDDEAVATLDLTDIVAAIVKGVEQTKDFTGLFPILIAVLPDNNGAVKIQQSQLKPLVNLPQDGIVCPAGRHSFFSLDDTAGAVSAESCQIDIVSSGEGYYPRTVSYVLLFI